MDRQQDQEEKRHKQNLEKCVWASFCSLPPMTDHSEFTCPLAATHVDISAHGNPLGTQQLGFLLGTDHVGTLCQSYVKIPLSQKESRGSE